MFSRNLVNILVQILVDVEIKLYTMIKPGDLPRKIKRIQS